MENTNSLQEVKLETNEIEERIGDVEKNSIEVEILNTISHEHQQQEKEKEVEQPTKLKCELIADFIGLQKTQGNIVYNEKKLKKLTKPEIIKLIAEFSNNVLSNETENGTEPFSNESGIENLPDATAVVAQKFELIGTGIYNLNLAMMSMLETGSVIFKERTGDVAVLENLTKSIERRREAYIGVFKQLYSQYKNELDIYLTPLSMYCMLTSQVIIETIALNVAQKKKESKEN